MGFSGCGDEFEEVVLYWCRRGDWKVSFDNFIDYWDVCF